MMKSVVLISVLVAMGQAQRPPYAGSAHRYPEVLTRFQDEQNSTATTTTTTTTTTVRSSTPEVVDRLGSTSRPTAAPDNAPSSSTPAPKITTSSDAILYPSEELPVLSLGDAELVNRIKTWPRDKQPWWYINRGAIQEHLNPSTQTNVLRPEAAAKPFFAG